MTTTELQRELADASQVIAALTAKLERAGETIKGLEATIGSLRHERERERLAHAKAWDAMSARIAMLEEAGDECARYSTTQASEDWHAAKETKP